MDKQIHVRLDEQEHRLLRLLCVQGGASIQMLVSGLIRDFLNENKTKLYSFLENDDKKGRKDSNKKVFISLSQDTSGNSKEKRRMKPPKKMDAVYRFDPDFLVAEDRAYYGKGEARD